jgi:hypothetical protein
LNVSVSWNVARVGGDSLNHVLAVIFKIKRTYFVKDVVQKRRANNINERGEPANINDRPKNKKPHSGYVRFRRFRPTNWHFETDFARGNRL